MAFKDILKIIFNKVIPFLAKPICIIILILQMIILDYYLIVYTSKDIHVIATENLTLDDIDNATVVGIEYNAWYCWVIPDLLVIALFITAFVKCHHHFKKSSKDQDNSVGIGGELPFGYIAWGVYSVIMAIKLYLIFRWSAQTLDPYSFDGPNLLKIGVALSCIVWIMLVLNHIDDEKEPARESFINVLIHSVTMDVLDTSEILQGVFIQESHIFLSFSLHKTIMVVACINLVLPTILLFALSQTRFGKVEKWRKRLSVIHKTLFFLCINLPLLVIRAVLWHVHKQTVSVFIVKNTIALGIMCRVIALQAADALNEDEVADTDIEMKPTGSVAADTEPAPEVTEPTEVGETAFLRPEPKDNTTPVNV